MMGAGLFERLRASPSLLLSIAFLILAACGGKTAPCGEGAEYLNGVCVASEAGAPLPCGPGTHQVDNWCIPDPAGDAGPLDATVDAFGEVDSSVEDGGDATDGALDSAPDGTTDAAPDSATDAATDSATDAALDGATDAATDSATDSAADSAADAGPDALQSFGTSDAPSFGIDPAHRNAQGNDIVASPLTPLWTVSFAGQPGYPLVMGTRVFVAVQGPQPNVRALDLATGSLLWGPVIVGANPLISADTGAVFVLTGAGALTALDASDGHTLWTTALQGQWSFYAPPVSTNGKVYINGLGVGGTTYAVDEATGVVVWKKGTFDGSFGAVAVAAGVVYEAEACDQLSAFDAATGALGWYHSSTCTGGGGKAPAVYQNLIYERDVPLGNTIIDLSGQDVGTFQSEVVPAFDAGVAYYLHQGTLLATNLSSNTVKWSFTGGGNLCTSPVVAGGVGQVFVGSSSGNVYELDAVTGAQRSVHKGQTLVCGPETSGMTIASGRLLTPTTSGLVAY